MITRHLSTRGLPRYVVLYFAGVGPANPWPMSPREADAAGLACDTLADARAIFAREARELGRDGVPTDDGGPSALVYLSGSWDGISYGDYTHQAHLSIGPRGGIRSDRF